MGSLGYLRARRLDAAARGGCLLEVGSAGPGAAGGGSTVALAAAALLLGVPFYSIDVDTRASLHAAAVPGVTALRGRAEDILDGWPATLPPRFAWLDGHDWPYSFYCPDQVVAEYQARGDALTGDASQESHLRLAVALHRVALPGALAAFDDTWQRLDRTWTGKGGTAVPFLLGAGWHVSEQSRPAAEPSDGYVILDCR